VDAAVHVAEAEGQGAEDQAVLGHGQIGHAAADDGRIIHVEAQDGAAEEGRHQHPEDGVGHRQHQRQAEAALQVVFVLRPVELGGEDADAADHAVGDHRGQGIDLGGGADRRDLADP